MSVRAAVAAFIAAFAVGGNDDGHYNRVGFSLHCEGVHGATSTVDSGPFAKTVTRSGTGTISTTTAAVGTSSWANGNGNSYLSLAQDTTNITASGSMPWTWEARIRAPDFTTSRVLFDNNNSASNTSGWQIYVNTSGQLMLYSGPQAANYGGGIAMVANTWYAAAVTWDGTTLRFYLDGLLQFSTTAFTNVWGNLVIVGNSAYLNQGWTGNYDEVRYTKYVARYTGSAYGVATRQFPNSAPDVFWSNNSTLMRFDALAASKDEKGRAWTMVGTGAINNTRAKFGLGSLQPGSSGGMTTAHHVDLEPEAFNFTAECWFYPTAGATGAQQTLMEKWNTSGWWLNLSAAAPFRLYGGFQNATDGSKQVVGTTTVTLNTWHHAALVKRGTDVLLFLDGVLEGTATGLTAPVSSGTSLNVGFDDGNQVGTTFAGSIDEVRIGKGIARYNAAFVPPQGPYGGKPQGAGICTLAAPGTHVISAGFSVALTVPATAVPGQLLVAVLSRRSLGDVATDPPTGWTLVSASPPADNGAGTIQYSLMYAKIAVAGDAGSTVTFTSPINNRLLGQILAFSGTTGTPWVEQQAGSATTTASLTAMPIPVLAVSRAGRMGLACAAYITALVSPSPTGISADNSWATQGSPTAVDNRLGVVTKALAAGSDTSGTITSTVGGTPPIAMTANVLVLAG